MSILSSISRKNLALNDDKAWDSRLWNLIGGITSSGQKVDEETALTYSAFFNAVYIIAETVAGLPLHLMQKKGKVKTVADDIDLYYLMHDEPNPFMTSLVFRETIMAHILTWGNGFVEKVRNKMGQIVELWPIPPNRIKSIEYREEDRNLWYEIKVGNETTWLSRDNILHIPGLGFDGYIGYSIVTMAKKSIGLSMAMEEFGSLYFGQGTHPGVIVSHPGKLDSQTRSNMRQSLDETYGGLGKSHRLMLLEEGLKIEKIGIPPNDSQFLESRQFQVPEIARWFNLPPHKLKDLSKSSFNNIESEQISFVTDSILPWVIRMEQNYNNQILSKPQRRKDKYYWKHNMEGLLRSNSKDRADFITSLIKNTVITPNEARALEDMNPSDNPYADELFTQMATVPLSMLKEMQEKKSQSSKSSQTSESSSGDSEDDPQNGNPRTKRGNLIQLGGANVNS